MSVTLTQSAAAAFPDRPGGAGALGLRVDLATGNDGAWLAHDLGTAPAVLRVRLLLRIADAGAGAVVILRGETAAGQETFRWDLAPGDRTLSVLLATGQALAAALPVELDWHCLELALDTAAGAAELRCNGVVVDQASGDLSALATRRLRLGAFFKDTDLAGQLHLDEWVIEADGAAPIGVVAVPPTSPWADDPARWLVIYNRDQAASRAFAAEYRRRRNLPWANLCGLSLPSDEVIDYEAWVQLNDAVNAYLADNHLEGQVLGLLLAPGVPGYCQSGQAVKPIPALLHSGNAEAGTPANPLATWPPTRPTAEALAGLRLTARMDGPTPADALALLDRAEALHGLALDAAGGGTLWLDPWISGEPGSVYAAGQQAMAAWAASMERMLTRLPLRLSAPTDPHADARFDAIHGDALFWGWSLGDVPANWFGEPPGARAFFAQLQNVTASADSLRTGGTGNWARAALEAGYAAAAGSAGPWSVSLLPDLARFMCGLRQGWTLAEAWFVALPFLRDGLFLAGDPLLRLALPRAGWDLWGPLKQLESLADAEAPALALRADETVIALPDALRPAAGQVGVYLLRRRDAAGQREAGCRSLRVAHHQGLAAAAPLPPVWPEAADWPAAQRDGRVRPAAVWEDASALRGVSTLELQAQAEGGPAQCVRSLRGAELRRPHVEVDLPRPTQPTRFRWRVTGAGGAAIDTPWSAAVGPAPAVAALALQPLENLA